MSKVNLAKAKANLKAYVRKDLSKRELVQFRIDEDHLKQLLEMAEKEKMPLGTMVRDWVIEKLQEKQNTKDVGAKSSTLRVSESQESYRPSTRSGKQRKLIEQCLSEPENIHLLAELVGNICNELLDQGASNSKVRRNK